MLRMKRDVYFPFQFERSLQAAAHLLKKAGGTEIAYIHLLKMLYIADREYLAENGYTLTGDRPVAMKHGPVLSHIYGLMRFKDSLSDRWHQYIGMAGSSRVRLINDPGGGELSRLASAKLDSVFERYGHLKPFEVVQLTHEFPEWQKNYKDSTSMPITLHDILQAQNKTDMESAVLEQIQLQRHTEKMKEILNEAR